MTPPSRASDTASSRDGVHHPVSLARGAAGQRRFEGTVASQPPGRHSGKASASRSSPDAPARRASLALASVRTSPSRAAPSRSAPRPRQPVSEQLLRDGARAAKAARLEYARLDGPGWTRRRRGKSFIYHDQRGRQIRDESALARVRALAIPPAWTHVWISPSPRAHIQAIGRDARGRKQYRYHERFRALRDAAKYLHVLRFGQKLPSLRRRLSRDSGRAGLERDKVLATVIRILERTCIRVGNDRYAEDNGSFGVTTLRNRHVRVRGKSVDLDFRGKGGKRHRIHLDDARLTRIVKSCRDVPGQCLFQYFSADCSHHAVTSGDVNDYLRRVTGEPFSAKDFRTWSGTLLAVNTLAVVAPEQTLSARRREIKRALASVSEELGNTIAVCRKSYVHPAVIDQYTTGQLQATYRKAARQAQRHPIRGLTRPETIALRWLEALPKLPTR